MHALTQKWHTGDNYIRQKVLSYCHFLHDLQQSEMVRSFVTSFSVWFFFSIASTGANVIKVSVVPPRTLASLLPETLTAIGPNLSFNQVLSMMMMMRRFVKRVLNSPQRRCQSIKQVALEMSGERQYSISDYTVPRTNAKSADSILCCWTLFGTLCENYSNY